MARNKKNKSAKSHSAKKNSAQLNSYKSFLSNPQNQPEDTVDVCNQNLTGTNVLQVSEHSASHSDKPLPPPLGIRAKRFFETYGIWGIIITAFLSFSVWIVNSIHQNDLAIERLTVQLEYIEEKLDNLDTDGINSEQLEEEIDELRTSLEASWGLNIKDIENRINIIELTLENLEDRVPTTP